MTLMTERDHITQGYIKTMELAGIVFQTIGNPESVLSENEKTEITMGALGILKVSTGIENRETKDIQRYTFGLKDRGRVLCVFRDGARIVGFISFHLVNDGEKYLRFGGSTVLHAGSGHILPEYQGNRLWQHATNEFLSSLPGDLRPRYMEGFTQSPVFLHLFTLINRGRIYPKPNNEDVEDLAEIQGEILQAILRDFSPDVTVCKRCVVQGIGSRVYNMRIHDRDNRFNDLFYKELGVMPEEGDFVHFVAEMPDRF